MRVSASLLEGVPAGPRALSEVGFVLALVFGPATVAALAPRWPWLRVLALVALALWAALLVRPWRARSGAVLVGLLVSVALAVWATPQRGPRLGAQLEDDGGAARVERVVAGLAADGALQPGDRVLGLNGERLDEKAPTKDLTERLGSNERVPPGRATFLVERDGRALEVQVLLPEAPPKGVDRGVLAWSLLKDLALLGVVAALLWVNRQAPASIGLGRAGWARELALGVPVMIATLVVHVTVTVPIAVAVSLFGKSFATSEASQRVDALQGLTVDTPVWQFALAMVVVATFEEVVFRGFLLPRVRQLTGRWWLAVLLVTAAFGLGHLYEGTLAVAQTMVLGVCFSVAFLWRGHLGSVIVAHGLFNTAMFSLMVGLQRSGLLDKLKELPL